MGTCMNIQLRRVIASMSGVTGMRIVRAIVAAERDPAQLGPMRDVRCKERLQSISGAPVINCQAEHVLALNPALALSDFHLQCIDGCDRERSAPLWRASLLQCKRLRFPIQYLSGRAHQSLLFPFAPFHIARLQRRVMARKMMPFRACFRDP
jgi:hypothetical protein